MKSGKKLTPLTKETFLAYRKKKRALKLKKIEESRKKAAKKQGGKGLNVLSGKALFMYDPSLFKDDDDAAADEVAIVEKMMGTTLEVEDVKVDASLFLDDDDLPESDDE